jgi:putative ABC transport system permease protein
MTRESPGALGSLRRVVAPAVVGLRTYWVTAALLLAAAVAALAALLPVTSLVAPDEAGVAPRLALAPWRGGGLGIPWTTFAWDPTATQHAALVMLFRLLFDVAAAVLAVAGLTMISLSAARAAVRAPEIRVQRAVGASRRHVLVTGLLESGAIAGGALLVGGGLGLAAARAAVRAWPGALGPAHPWANGMAVLAAVGGIVLGAMLPLALPRRTSPLTPSHAKPLELVVPAFQLGLSLTVLTAASLLGRQAERLTAIGAGNGPQGQLLELTAPESPPRERALRYGALLRRLHTRPSFDAASLTSPGTLVGLGVIDFAPTECGNCAQGGIALPIHPVAVTHHLVTADTFRVLGLALVAGRGIGDADGWDADHVAVVNQSLAARHFEGGAAVGRRILVGGSDPEWHQVIGIVRDQRPTGFGGGLEPPEAVYLSALQHPARSIDLLVRGPADARTLAGVEREVRGSLGSETQMRRVSEAALAAAETAPLRWFGSMFAMEGWVLLTSATLGTFIVMRLWVISRLYELGLRRAVGAHRRDIFGFVLARAAGVAVGGVAIGLWLGLVVWGALSTIVAGLPPWDLGAAVRVAPLLIGAALAGASIPAWQAARTPPVGLLQQEG